MKDKMGDRQRLLHIIDAISEIENNTLVGVITNKLATFLAGDNTRKGRKP